VVKSSRKELNLTDYTRERRIRSHSEDGGCKRQEKSQGNVCQGNNPENAFFHSLDYHSPDFALDRQASVVTISFPQVLPSPGLRVRHQFDLLRVVSLNSLGVKFGRHAFNHIRDHNVCQLPGVDGCGLAIVQVAEVALPRSYLRMGGDFRWGYLLGCAYANVVQKPHGFRDTGQNISRRDACDGRSFWRLVLAFGGCGNSLWLGSQENGR
jgi:hypothetical protein